MNTSESDLSLLMLGLTCLAAITKLGSTKVSCQQFFSMVPDIIGRFMDMLLEFVPLSKAYTLTKDIGLQREFLCNFGPRAADPKFSSDRGVEISFWIDLVQKQLLRALDREKIWSRLTTSESIEVGTKDISSSFMNSPSKITIFLTAGFGKGFSNFWVFHCFRQKYANIFVFQSSYQSG